MKVFYYHQIVLKWCVYQEGREGNSTFLPSHLFLPVSLIQIKGYIAQNMLEIDRIGYLGVIPIGRDYTSCPF